eukprot:s1862_g9.t1
MPGFPGSAATAEADPAPERKGHVFFTSTEIDGRDDPRLVVPLPGHAHGEERGVWLAKLGPGLCHVADTWPTASSPGSGESRLSKLPYFVQANDFPQVLAILADTLHEQPDAPEVGPNRSAFAGTCARSTSNLQSHPELSVRYFSNDGPTPASFPMPVAHSYEEASEYQRCMGCNAPRWFPHDSAERTNLGLTKSLSWSSSSR